MSGHNPLLPFLQKYRNDPVGFIRDVWGVEPIYYQKEILEDIFNPDERSISARSGHGVGKTTTAAWASIIFLLTRFRCKAVLTAPTSKQLYDALFAEIRDWTGQLPDDLERLLLVKSDTVQLRAAPESAFISARTSRAEQPEALQGVHSDHVLLIVDEASGVPNAVYEAASGSMSSPSATTLLRGNPVHAQGYFYETQTKLAHLWKTYHISCFDAPEWLVDPPYAEEQRALFGEESNVYRVRVLGEFPLHEDDTIVPMGWVVDSVGRDIEVAPNTPVVWGVDVARKGKNKSALTKRQGKRVLEPPRVWKNLNLMQLSGRILHEWEETLPHDRPVDINVDALGLGIGVVDRLREHGLPVRPINVSELVAMNARQYLNLKSELWFEGARAWFEALDCHLPPGCQDLIDGLVAVRYDFTSSGKLQVETKRDLENRGQNANMDVADSFVLTFASPAGRSLHGSRYRHDAPLRRNVPGIV